MVNKINQILNFCGYFSTNQNKINLSVHSLNNIQKKSAKPSKSTKRKFQPAPSKKSNNKQTVTKMLKYEDDDQLQQNFAADKYDLSYYISHIASSSPQKKNSYQIPSNSYNVKKYEPYYQENPRQNFQKMRNNDSFMNANLQKERTPNSNGQYLTFADKMKAIQLNKNQKAETIAPKEKPARSHQFWNPDFSSRIAYNRQQKQFEASINRNKISFAHQNYEPRRSNISIQTYEPYIYDSPSESNLLYSPVRRNSKINNSSFYQNINFSPNKQTSRSKSKNKRKNGQRPFFNASQLPKQIRQKNEERISDFAYNKSNYNQEEDYESEIRESPKKIHQIDESEKRETISTMRQTVDHKIPNQLNSKNIIDMDDACQQYLRLAISNRKISTPIQIKTNNYKKRQ